MAVKEGKTRIIVTIPIELKDKLDILCDKEKRTLSKQVEYILEKYINKSSDSISLEKLKSIEKQINDLEPIRWNKK